MRRRLFNIFAIASLLIFSALAAFVVLLLSTDPNLAYSMIWNRSVADPPGLVYRELRFGARYVTYHRYTLTWPDDPPSQEWLDARKPLMAGKPFTCEWRDVTPGPPPTPSDANPRGERTEPIRTANDLALQSLQQELQGKLEFDLPTPVILFLTSLAPIIWLISHVRSRRERPGFEVLPAASTKRT